MSVISQFFPSGTTGGGGGSTNIGGGTIPVEILGISGGGGGGGCSLSGPCPGVLAYGGAGGMGAAFYADNYYLNPGTTYPITIGSGGAGATAQPCAYCGANRGSNGTYTSFNNPCCSLCVQGGGGGGGGSFNPTPCNPGLPGGTGGAGSGGGGASNLGVVAGNCGLGKYYRSSFKVEEYSVFTGAFASPTGSGNIVGRFNEVISQSENMKTPWGYMSGFPGSAGANGSGLSGGSPTCVSYYGIGGGMAGNAAYGVCSTSSNCPNLFCCLCVSFGCSSRCLYSDISGTETHYGSPTAAGAPGPGATAGGAGALIIKWPSNVLGAAAPTGFPGGTDISPQTPGYYTYCFTSSGSITLP